MKTKIFLLIALVFQLKNISAQDPFDCNIGIQFESSYYGCEPCINDGTFDDCYFFEIDSSVNNIWQIGIPSKLIFNSAESLPLAIVTDTFNYYPTNNSSSFIIKIPSIEFAKYDSIEPTGWYIYELDFSFFYKINSDTLKDGGYAEFSIDNGQNWFNCIDNNAFHLVYPQNSEQYIEIDNSQFYTYNDTLFNGKYGFSGTSLEWQQARFFLNKNEKLLIDTFLFRFNFESDSININKEGWMIDNITITYYYDYYVNIKSQNNLKEEFKIFPNPLTTESFVTFQNLNNDIFDLEIFNSYGKLIFYNKNLTKKLILKKEYFTNGLYIIRARSSNNISTNKLIVY